MANAIRALAMDAVESAKSGHPGLPMGAADLATVLFTRFLRFDPAAPDWPDRDRFVLSAGHGSMLLYAVLYLLGYENMTIEEIRNFRQLGSLTPGHPEAGHTAGVETTTGPLGQGIATAVGMALAERILAARFGKELVDHYTYVLASDGDLMEGVSHEAISLAGHLRLGKLIVLFDDNEVTIDGPLSLAESGDVVKRFQAAGWHARRIDGHDEEAIAAAIADARRSERPSLIAARTVIGYGAPRKQGTAECHGAPLGAAEIEGARTALGWTAKPFEIPPLILDAWRLVGLRGHKTRLAWEARRGTFAAGVQDDFARALAGGLPEDLLQAVNAHKKAVVKDKIKAATRKSSQDVLEVLTKLIPEMVGGSADLTGSNNTKTAALSVISPDNYAGRFIHYGVREHAMAAAMNGMALHRGIIPYSGSFLTFTDYCRPAIRLSALMQQRVIYVMTHDSIGLGEDGPTHQPIEHFASLRAIPNLNLFRPADSVETAECWLLALHAEKTPSILALSRQTLPLVRTSHNENNLCARGGYELVAANGKAVVSLLASGSEVAVALGARDILQSEGIATRVVSLPCFELFEAQSPDYRSATLGADTLRVGVEAGVGMGWERYIGENGLFIGMTGFGASAPAPALYEYFGITAAAVAAAVRTAL
jgi:transketolase